MTHSRDTWTSDAIQRDDIAAIKQRVHDDPDYLTSRDFIDNTPLLTAIGGDHAELVGFLLESGADPNVEVDDGYTCLLTAIDSDDPDAMPIVELLLNARADLHHHGVNGWTALHMAAAHGHTNTVRLLLDAGAAIDRRAPIDDGRTPLMEAAAMGHPEVVRLLLERGADAGLRDTIREWRPFEIAQNAARGADPDVIACLEQLPRPTDPELADIDLVASYRDSANEVARDGDHAAVLEILRAAGAG